MFTFLRRSKVNTLFIFHNYVSKRKYKAQYYSCQKHIFAFTQKDFLLDKWQDH